ncbi:sugar kinase [PVC group bacterium]|nr:sugar kinase [PVC group bacterium]
MSVTVVGSTAIDTIQTPFGKASSVLGGSATYFAMAASYFCSVRIVSVVGQDFPDDYFQVFHDHNIQTEGISVTEGKTFTWTGRYNDALDSATTLDVAVNVLENFEPRIPASYQGPDILFLANINPGVQLQVVKKIHPKYLIAMDTMNIWIETKREALLEVIRHVDIIILNDAEARLLTGQAVLPKAARVIASWGPKRVIIKKGEHGAFMSSENGFFVIPAFIQEKLVDTTGAGDSFAGGFLGSLCQSILDKKNTPDEKNYREAVIYGNVMASFTVEDFSVEKLRGLDQDDIYTRRKNILNQTSVI